MGVLDKYLSEADIMEENKMEMQPMVDTTDTKDHKTESEELKAQREKIEEFAAQLHSNAQNKNFTKGFADLALLTANVNQLRHVLAFEDDSMRTVNIVFLSLSIFLQVSSIILDV